MNSLERIRTLLDERGWSVNRLAKESGVLQSTLSNMFNRNNDPSISTLESICHGFGISMLQFFSIEGSSVVLTEEQLSLLGGWNRLNKAQKDAILLIIQGLNCEKIVSNTEKES